MSDIIRSYSTALHWGKYQDVAGAVAVSLVNAVLDDIYYVTGCLYQVFIFNKEEVGLHAVADMNKYLLMINLL